jgi:hypothetical protein
MQWDDSVQLGDCPLDRRSELAVAVGSTADARAKCPELPQHLIFEEGTTLANTDGVE